MSPDQPLWRTILCLYVSAHVFHHQQRSRRNRRQDVSRQLRLRKRKEDNWHQQPDHKKYIQRILVGCSQVAFLPPGTSNLVERRQREQRPRQEPQQGNRKVEPKRLRVMVEIGSEAGQVVLQEEDAEELRMR